MSSPRSPAPSVKSLAGLASKVAPGPSPSFDASHILLVFLTIGSSNYVGRQTLAARSRLGEGAIRTILKKLKEEGYVDAIKSGCFLTNTGKALAKSIKASLSISDSMPPSDLSMGKRQAALILRGAGRRVRLGIEQRDSAIGIGASGATTYVIRGGRFTIPGGSSDCEKDFPNRAWQILKRELGPRSGDAVILCGAEDEVTARLGALAAAITLF